MATELQWSGQFTASPGANLPGDKIVLPQSALEQLLSAASSAAATAAAAAATSQDSDNHNSYSSYYAGARLSAQPQRSDEQKNSLPHPLTFRLVNAANGRIVYAGIREFSAEEDHTVLSPFIWQALDLKEEAAQITIHAKQIPKGTYVKLRPLEAGYDPDDWKALLERHLRLNYTTLTRGEVLVVLGPANQEFRFLVDTFQPESDAICVVDTDLEVDIEALNEEQARETLRQIAQKIEKSQSAEGSSKGGDVDIFNTHQGHVAAGEYVDYQLPSWPRTQPLEIEVEATDAETEVDVLVSPFSARQRNRPRLDEHVFSDLSGRPTKRVRLEPSNIELEDAEALFISVHAFRPADASESTPPPRQFTLRVRPGDMKESTIQVVDEGPPDAEHVRCNNCNQWVPQRSLMLHENFCLRNNIVCPHGCGQVFQKRSPALDSHWHCPHDTFYGTGTTSRQKHDHLYHPDSPFTCTACSTTQTFSSLPQLAHHKTSVCPAKTILCRFCHLSVPQEGDPDVPNPEALLSGLTPHELADGSRTTECHLCSRIVRLRDMDTHLKHHDFSRKSRASPRLCRNINCGRTMDGVSHDGNTRATTKDPGNDIGLCAACFGPLYVSTYDPDGRALKRRIERRYLQQLLTGCGKPWCRNSFCKTGRTNTNQGGAMSTKEALPMIKPFVDATIIKTDDKPLHFCVDEGSQSRRGLAEMMAAEQGLRGERYTLPWCIGALEAENGDLDKSREWLSNWAPTRSEEGN